MKTDLSDLIDGGAEDRNVNLTSVADTRYARMARAGYDLESRTIWLDGEIEDTTGDWFRYVTWALETESPKTPITVWLNTPGGDVPSMYQIYDAIVGSPSDITMIGHGEIVSAGVLIFVAGHKRLVTDNCVFMSHEGADFGGGGGLRHSEAKDRRRYEDWQMSRWNELMARHTPYTAAHWKQITSKKAEFWLLGAEEIIAYGIAEGVYDPAGRLSKFEPTDAPEASGEVD